MAKTLITRIKNDGQYDAAKKNHIMERYDYK